ncbi:hypothetical protein HHL22_04550 [Hymenobacter sp. RP-2-7]|uniref:Uncharacterized protein n=1 Tax=Hymenobacter polaris TaxID=2682546 RepID=A0A7Y0FL58_9BACT|nr:hypothetical protein [Hymenobacter polaris]NML64468.1 hypothetical protein [Hymenobacter polaris]
MRTVTFLLSIAGSLGLAGCAKRHYFQRDAVVPAPSAARPNTADSVWATAGRQYAQHGFVNTVLVGRHHRAAWAAPVRVPVLHLATAWPTAGPLTPTKLGGGFQTTSLTLKGADGRSYALRSIDKDPSRILPKFWQRTFVANALRDATSAGLGYGALVVAPLAQALGVPHTHPRLEYVPPEEQQLGSAEANQRLRGKLALLEEKYSSKRAYSPLLPQATDFLSDEDMRKLLYEDPHYRPDQPALLQARLLDVLVGDWDRHAGQWQWALSPDPAAPATRHLFAPVPKDRDQVFFRLADGTIPWLLTRRVLVRHLVTFRHRYHDLVALTGQGRYVDQRGLNELTQRDFVAAAERTRQRLPDSVLARAVRRLPPAVYALEGPRLLRDLQARRDALPAVAARYYRLKAERPVVAGTNQPDHFVVRRAPDSTTVQVYSRTLGPDSLYYQRTFYTRETKRLTLEGLESRDLFEVSGARGLRLVIHAGAGPDVLRAPSRRRLRYEEEANGRLNRPEPKNKHEQFYPYDRLEDE